MYTQIDPIDKYDKNFINLMPTHPGNPYNHEPSMAEIYLQKYANLCNQFVGDRNINNANLINNKFPYPQIPQSALLQKPVSFVYIKGKRYLRGNTLPPASAANTKMQVSSQPNAMTTISNNKVLRLQPRNITADILTMERLSHTILLRPKKVQPEEQELEKKNLKKKEIPNLKSNKNVKSEQKSENKIKKSTKSPNDASEIQSKKEKIKKGQKKINVQKKNAPEAKESSKSESKDKESVVKIIFSNTPSLQNIQNNENAQKQTYEQNHDEDQENVESVKSKSSEKTSESLSNSKNPTKQASVDKKKTHGESKINKNLENNNSSEVKKNKNPKVVQNKKIRATKNVSDTQKRSESKNRKESMNKKAKSVTSTEDSAKNPPGDNGINPITEIFKSSTNNSLYASSEDLNDSPSLQKQQIRDVPLTKTEDVAEIPSALIKTKPQQFFKNTKENQKANTELPKKPITPPQSKSRPNSTSNSPTSSANSSRRSSKTSLISKSSASSSNSNKPLSRKSSFQSYDLLTLLKEEVRKAVRARKTFTVQGGFNSIRKALKARGWVEKFHKSYYDHMQDDLKRYQNYSISELILLARRVELTELCKDFIRSKLLANYQVDFYWGPNIGVFADNPDTIKLTMVNKLKRDIFSYTNKQGLCDASKYAHWYQKPNVSKLNHPRSYAISNKNSDFRDFIEDFRKTAAMSLLKWIVKNNITKEIKLISPTGKVPLEVFDFAVNECCKFIKKQTHEDIDTIIPEATDREWNTFLDYFYKIMHYCNHFTKENQITEEVIVSKANFVINTLRETWPWIDMDGMMNIWILKPVGSSMGRGIRLCRTLEYALKIIKNNTERHYIIQKYIERPLLIHDTKFDIRQWFLISNCSPLTIWMYKECYLRFSSQTYNLRKLHESIHLTNNSVQKKYKNNSLDAVLPSYNMWDSKVFIKYLADIGYPNAFKNIIYPGMKQCITAAVLTHQDKIVIRKNCFELLGADFILTEDFQPWLLEINSNPALFASTPVTSRMGPKVLEDVIRVMIDYARNTKARTGEFEMIYKERILELPKPTSLEVKGVALNKEYFNPAPNEKALVPPTNKNKYDKPIIITDNQGKLKSFTEEVKKTLKNLLNIIHEERRKRAEENF